MKVTLPRSRPPLWREARFGLEAAALLRDPILRGDGLGDGRGRPVLLIPGFLAGDGSLAPMSDWLRRAGFRPSRAGNGGQRRLRGAHARPPRGAARAPGRRAGPAGGRDRPEPRRRHGQGAGGAPTGPRLGPDHARLAPRAAARHPSARAAAGRGGQPARDRSARRGLFKRSCLDGECCSSFWETLARPAARRRRLRLGLLAAATASSTGAPASIPARTSTSRSPAATAGWPSARAAWRAVAAALEAFRGGEPRARKPEVRRLRRVA